ncbi:MAG: CRTAC1 family protein, partial [Armatimonadota bacterium]
MRCTTLVALVPALVSAALSAPAQAPPPLAFTDACEYTGLRPHFYGALNHDVAWGDFDGDGRLDLFLGNFCDRGAQPTYGLAEATPNRLFRQTADGKFVHVPMPSVETRGRTSGAVLADLDNDGDLDLYVNNNTHAQPSAVAAKNEPPALYRNDGGEFVNISKECGACPPDGFLGRDVGVFDYDNDGLLDLLVVEETRRSAGHTRLYRNLGDLRFSDVTGQVGLPDDLDGLGVAIADLNGDNRPDFYLGGCNRLYLSRPRGKYEEAPSLREVFDIHPMHGEDIVTGACLADIDNDGDSDLTIGIHTPGARVRVYVNEGLRGGVPQFRNVTRELGVPVLPNKGPSCDIADFDNNGWPDLYWSLAFAEGKLRTPFICRGLGVREGLPRIDVPSVEGLDMSLVRDNSVPPGKRGMAYYGDGNAVDYDGDGDLDIIGGGWPPEMSHLFRNDTGGFGNYLQVKVVGTKMNRMGVGAKIRALSGGKLVGYRELWMNGGYSASKQPIAHFGLGELERVDLEVTLPSRRRPLRFTD